MDLPDLIDFDAPEESPTEWRDPASLTYPATLPIEVAMRTAPIKDICEAYNLSRDQWRELSADPLFIEDVRRSVDELKKDGMSFRVKARLQAEELLKKSWQMIHDEGGNVPPSVKADLLKFTVRCAGLEITSKDQALASGTALNIQINLG